MSARCSAESGPPQLLRKYSAQLVGFAWPVTIDAPASICQEKALCSRMVLWARAIVSRQPAVTAATSSCTRAQQSIFRRRKDQSAEAPYRCVGGVVDPVAGDFGHTERAVPGPPPIRRERRADCAVRRRRRVVGRPTIVQVEPADVRACNARRSRDVDGPEPFSQGGVTMVPEVRAARRAATVAGRMPGRVQLRPFAVATRVVVLGAVLEAEKPAAVGLIVELLLHFSEAALGLREVPVHQHCRSAGRGGEHWSVTGRPT